ncbi:hypothetical protein C8Q80DRAFT_465811 [Daedaleopsis nitida]|nr:hypothetical protein C8Q80DRAFT_465811 [Daedaleopsis nitida]
MNPSASAHLFTTRPRTKDLHLSASAFKTDVHGHGHGHGHGLLGAHARLQILPHSSHVLSRSLQRSNSVTPVRARTHDGSPPSPSPRPTQSAQKPTPSRIPVSPGPSLRRTFPAKLRRGPTEKDPGKEGRARASARVPRRILPRIDATRRAPCLFHNAQCPHCILDGVRGRPGMYRCWLQSWVPACPLLPTDIARGRGLGASFGGAWAEGRGAEGSR